MNVSHPSRSVIPSLDGPVFEVVAGTTHPLTTLAVHRLARVGSPNGIRLVLERLAEHGLVHADRRGNAIYYTANREHLAWPAIERLAHLRRTLFERLATEIAAWEIPALHASLFGSSARGDGGPGSDVDILLVRDDLGPEVEDAWEAQVDRLRAHVLAMTGNRCQAFVVTRERLHEHRSAGDQIVESWLRDCLLLAGEEIATMLAERVLA